MGSGEALHDRVGKRGLMTYDTGFERKCPICNQWEDAWYLRRWNKCHQFRDTDLEKIVINTKPKSHKVKSGDVPIVINDMKMTLRKY